jgi:ABC-2 type transport system ATP-binding protein
MHKSDDIAIKVSNVSKTFKLPHEKAGSIKSLVVNPFKRRTYEKQQVLKDISFEIKKGEFFGIVGRNGSGKSTLLKLLAGIYSPDSGHIQVNGKLTPFIELGVGFNPELTGRENVFLNGALLGFNRKEMEAMYDEIVEFAELEKFMDQKLKNYSSGMQVRLAFSIAIRAKSDILVLDEVLAVGDEAFQRKCYSYFSELKRNKKTVILVTHAMNNVKRFCDRGMILEKGEIKYIGNKNKVADEYEGIFSNKEITVKKTDNKPKENSADVEIQVLPVDSRGEKLSVFRVDDKLRFKIAVKSKIDIADAFLGFSIHKPSGEMVFITTTEHPNPKLPVIKKDKQTNVSLEIDNIFSEDNYSVAASIKSNDRETVYYSQKNISTFDVIVGGRQPLSLRPVYKISTINDKDS